MGCFICDASPSNAFAWDEQSKPAAFHSRITRPRKEHPGTDIISVTGLPKGTYSSTRQGSSTRDEALYIMRLEHKAGAYSLLFPPTATTVVRRELRALRSFRISRLAHQK
ncbi:hypothetical protein CMQ_5178 [Grosmannia clavigera kw1407]|uniref:Uncharacterized protein n=1 Tax=Grosmannia clavigera (strain kw1407 / UAMH 11150) TaxID=655863 RepID=F0XBF8_GROCL|nr:uncharacterized protein CMQ_5178 [Grosmannia clavigera kw1407]EFX04916.1 hypothetical protein CMQ_5178 [Grosmannia clavigera kw1407]